MLVVVLEDNRLPHRRCFLVAQMPDLSYFPPHTCLGTATTNLFQYQGHESPCSFSGSSVWMSTVHDRAIGAIGQPE